MPLGILVHESFESDLLSMLALTPEAMRPGPDLIAKLVDELDHDDPEIREHATGVLTALGILEIGGVPKALETAVAQRRSTEFGSRASGLLRLLGSEGIKSWRAAGGEKILRDLPFLAALLSFPREETAKAVKARLLRLLPGDVGREFGDKKPEEWSAWIKKHLGELKWSDAKQAFIR
jgi:hypothetical protein